MLEVTELHACVSCNRLLSEGDGPNEVKYRVNDPQVYDTFGLNISAYLCGACVGGES